jgi:RNA polymerase sigma-70 factor (ECF subfamily)
MGDMARSLNEARLKHWMAQLGPRLITLSTAICRDRHRAEEIVQEAFIKLWHQPPEAGEAVYPAWLRRVVTNLSINVLKRTPRPGALPEFSDDPAVQSSRTPAAALEDDEQVHRVREALDRLDDSKRSILILRAFEGLSYEQIAEHLGVPVGTVMSRLNRARVALMEEFERGATKGESATDVPATYDFRQYKRA